MEHRHRGETTPPLGDLTSRRRFPTVRAESQSAGGLSEDRLPALAGPQAAQPAGRRVPHALHQFAAVVLRHAVMLYSPVPRRCLLAR